LFELKILIFLSFFLIFKELKTARENEELELLSKEEVKLNELVEMDPAQMKLELSLLQRKFNLLEEREKKLSALCESFLKNQPNKETQVFIAEVTKILNSRLKLK
jgi:hypothetical protein